MANLSPIIEGGSPAKSRRIRAVAAELCALSLTRIAGSAALKRAIME